MIPRAARWTIVFRLGDVTLLLVYANLTVANISAAFENRGVEQKLHQQFQSKMIFITLTDKLSKDCNLK